MYQCRNATYATKSELFISDFYIGSSFERDVLDNVFSLAHEREFQIRVRICFRVPYLLRLRWSRTLGLILEQIVQAIISSSSHDHPILNVIQLAHRVAILWNIPLFPFVYFCSVVLRLSKDSQLASDRKEIIPLR